MKKQQIQHILSILTVNGFFSLLALFFIKLGRNNYDITNFIAWMHNDTKKMATYFVILFLIFICTYKLQMKVYNFLKTRFLWSLVIGKYLSIIFLTLFTSVIVNYFFQYFQWLQDPVSTTEWISNNFYVFLAGILYLQFVFLFLFAIMGNIFISSLLGSVLFVLIGFIHFNKLNLRTEPLYPMDFLQVTHMKHVVPMVAEFLSIRAILVVLLLVLIISFIIFMLPKMKINRWSRVAILLFSIYMVYAYTFFPKTFMKKLTDVSGIAVVQWSQLSNYEENGFIFGFISNLYNDSFEKPENYTKENVIKIANKYKSSNDEDTSNGESSRPNIVFIMSEAFWDPTKLENVSFSGDPLANLRKLMAENTSGQVLSPVFGGATANVEFEALTGITTSFLKIGSVPFQEFVDNKSFVPTIVSDLEQKGYKSLAIHPYNRVFYKRNRVYETFGIDTFLDQETMKNKGTTPGGVISDESLTYEIIDNLKNENSPLFIHAVTMQNHMPYNPGAYEENKIKVSGLKDESNAMLEVYTEGIRRSGEALQLLINQLEEIDEPTMIVFWGDHLPVLGANLGIYKEAHFDDPDQNMNELKYYETPLLIYSNFDTEDKNLNTVSPFYLGPIVYELGGLEKPAFYQILDQLRTHFSGLKSTVKINSEREFVTELSAEEQELLEDYRLIAYDLLLGKQYSRTILFEN